MSLTLPSFIVHDEPLAPYTTIGLGGAARLFAPCTTREELVTALAYAQASGIPAHILSGGSNTIFADEGFDGLVVHLRIRGRACDVGPQRVIVRAACGEPWDDLVAYAVENDWGGIECLSGIPGSVGATPVQNVGAYGQEVSDTVFSVTALDRLSLTARTFSRNECGFTYRQSIFKARDSGRFVITGVEFHLHPHGIPSIHYAELNELLEKNGTTPPDRCTLGDIRNAVMKLRRSKSMVVDPADENARSVGSFFTNPVISTALAERIRKEHSVPGDGARVPVYPVEGGAKLSAAWLIEQSGFTKGTRRGRIGISTRHALALVNHGGTTRELIEFAEEIRETVLTRFGVRLEREPQVIPFHPHRA